MRTALAIAAFALFSCGTPSDRCVALVAKQAELIGLYEARRHVCTPRKP